MEYDPNHPESSHEAVPNTEHESTEEVAPKGTIISKDEPSAKLEDGDDQSVAKKIFPQAEEDCTSSVQDEDNSVEKNENLKNEPLPATEEEQASAVNESQLHQDGPLNQKEEQTPFLEDMESGDHSTEKSDAGPTSTEQSESLDNEREQIKNDDDKKAREFIEQESALERKESPQNDDDQDKEQDESKEIQDNIMNQQSSEMPLSTALSVEESKGEESTQIISINSDVPPPSQALPWWYPKWRGSPIFYGTKEALGWCCCAVGQAGIFAVVGAFILPALAKLAKEEAGCETEAPEGEEIPECEGKVHGFKPSSLLTIMSSVVGLASAFIIPLIGAVVDFTSHRRLIGRWVSVFYALGIFAMVFLNDDSWLALCIVLLIAISIGWAQSMLMNAYLPELTDDENRLNEFSKIFTVYIFITMVFCLAATMGIAMGLDFADDDVAIARCSAGVAFVLSAFLFYASWWLLFEEKTAMHELPEGQYLWGAGFRQVHRTSIKIWKYYQGLKWFYISICFGDAAIQSLSVIAISYVTDQLQFTSQEVGSAGLLLLLGSIPGAVIGAWFNKKVNPIRSSALSVFGMMIGTALAAIVLTGPGQQLLTYCFAFLWGFGTGWKYTSDRVLAAGIVPEGQDAELMGFYMFCGQIFAWVPSLVYTVLNEAGASQRIGLSTLCFVFLGAFLSYFMMGDYSEAVRVADRLRVNSIPSVQHQQLLQHAKVDVESDMPPETAGP